MYIYIHLYTYIYTFSFTNIYSHIYICTHIYIYIYTCIYFYVYLCDVYAYTQFTRCLGLQETMLRKIVVHVYVGIFVYIFTDI